MEKVGFFIAILAASSTATANDAADWVEKYANQAVEYQQQNIELSCGYAEDRWHKDFDGHKLFAGAIGKATAQYENEVRKVAIEQCQNAWLYAGHGVAQNEENMARGCDLSGAIWHSDKSGHFIWAMRQTPYTIAVHDQQRRYLLSLCEKD